jgi:Family of unknown function (DUF6153)
MQSRQDSATGGQHLAARWFLPLILAVTVLAMHGLGHPGGHGGGTTGMAGARAAPVATPRHAGHLLATLPADARPTVSSLDVTGTAESGGLDPGAICLAVLAGTLLLLLPLLRRAGLPGALQGVVRVRAGLRHPGRSPPSAPDLSTLQVLRL